MLKHYSNILVRYQNKQYIWFTLSNFNSLYAYYYGYIKRHFHRILILDSTHENLKKYILKLGKIGSLPEVIFLVSLVSQIWSYVLLPFIFLLLIFVNVPVGIALENPFLRKQSKSVKQKIMSIKLVKHNLAQIIKTYSMFCNFLFIHWCQFLHKLLRISSMKWDVDKRKSVDNFTAFSKEPLFTYLYIIETMFFSISMKNDAYW